MGNSVLGVGLTGLNAAQAGLITTQHNISNASTPGFHRQQIIQGTANPQLYGAGYFGQGTSVEAVKRVYSQFLDNQVSLSETTSSYLDSFYTQVKQIDNLLADPTAGLSPSLQDFFNSVHAVAADASSVPARQGMLSSASALVGKFGTLSEQLQGMRDGVNGQIVSSVGEINSYISQIATLNDQIRLAQSTTLGAQPNDLLDQREQLTGELNKLVNVSVVKQDDGSVNLFIGSGQALIVGNRVFNLTTAKSTEDPENTVVAYSSGGSTAAPLSDNSLTGGTLGGLLSFRNTTLNSAFNGLGRVAVGLAQTFNEQHKLGVDLNGAQGGNFFNLSSATPAVISNLNNTGGAILTASYTPLQSAALTTDNYRISFDGTNYALTNLTTGSNVAGVTNAATLVAAVGNLGLTLNVNATVPPLSGDHWLLLPTRYGTSAISMAITNTSQIAAAAPVKTSTTLSNTGSGEISAGAVDSTFSFPLAAAVTLTYNSGTGKFSAAPAQAVTVTSGGTSTSYASGTPFTYVSGATISFGGISLVITGSPANTDTFTVSPNSGASFAAVSDSRNALLLAGLQTSSTLANNANGTATASYQGVYSQLVSEVGNKTREFEVRSKAQAIVVSQAQQQQQSLSGVNLDEEAANLVRYQQAYQAAGKSMQIAATLFATLLSIGG
jgi:flagellar hook-associated protein 1 FlgK